MTYNTRYHVLNTVKMTRRGRAMWWWLVQMLELDPHFAYHSPSYHIWLVDLYPSRNCDGDVTWWLHYDVWLDEQDGDHVRISKLCKAIDKERIKEFRDEHHLQFG